MNKPLLVNPESPQLESLIIDVSQGLQSAKYKIRKTINDHNFCILRGYIDALDVENGINKVKTFVENNHDHAVTGETPDQVRDYFMKLSIGEGIHSGKSIFVDEAIVRPRFKRAIYSPIGARDRFGLDIVFKKVAEIRNFCMGLDIDYATSSENQDGLWTAARMHQFPTGGGFMAKHTDTVLPRIISETAIGNGFFQPILVMSQKGRDFETGGGVAVVDGKPIIYEDFTEVGDIAIYNVNTIHGVAEIDSHKPFVQRSGNGRYSGLVTLYKQLGAN